MNNKEANIYLIVIGIVAVLSAGILVGSTISKNKHLDNCIGEAKQEHEERWNNHCEELGKESECHLPEYAGLEYVRRFEAKRDFCLERYK